MQNLTEEQSQCLSGGNVVPLSTDPFGPCDGRYCVVAIEAVRLAQLAGIGIPQARVVPGQIQPINSPRKQLN